MYVYFTVYGEPARGIEPTENREIALANGKRFGLVVFDTNEEVDMYDPRGCVYDKNGFVGEH